METKNVSKSIVKFLPWLCSLIYFVSYLSRKVYSVSLSLICDEEGVLRSVAGLAVTGLFISYGIGQIISGVLGDKIPQRTLVTIGLIGTALCNILVGVMPYFASNIVLVTIIWVLNGLFQSFFWPPLVKLLAKNCDNIESWSQCITSNLVPNVESYNNEQINKLLPLIVLELKNRDPFYNNLFCRFTEVYKERGRIL